MYSKWINYVWGGQVILAALILAQITGASPAPEEVDPPHRYRSIIPGDFPKMQFKTFERNDEVPAEMDNAHERSKRSISSDDLAAIDFVGERPQRYSFGLGKRSAPEFEEEISELEDPGDLKYMAKREPYTFGLGKRDPYAFGIGKREPYSFGIGKREPYTFGLGKRDPYAFGLGKRDPYAFGLGKREPYAFGLGKRDPYAFGIGKRDPYKFGLGKRAETYTFGLGKREPYAFGLGKRNYIRQV